MKKMMVAALCLSLFTASAEAFHKPVTLADQGSFTAGGTVVTAPGKLDNSKPLDAAGQTLHGDHAYVFYQKPVKAKKLGLVFLHGAGQSGKTWETTPDGRDGFQNLFLEKGYATYVVDQPRRGRAGQSTTGGTVSNKPMEQLWYDNFRIGLYPDVYRNAQVDWDENARDEFFRSMTPNTGAFDEQVISDAMAAVFEKSGDGVLMTHSQGGGPGWWTAIKSSHVKGVVALEPGSGFIFPEGEVPAPMETTSPFGALKGTPVARTDFEKLTKLPILVVYGDNIPTERTQEWNLDNWRVRLAMARLWVDTVNRHGGDATLLHLPEAGVYGNTHFLMSDKNNEKIASMIEAWMKEKKLDR
jgi:pimeloyl-ACP methyl ester carboxylesterase